MKLSAAVAVLAAAVLPAFGQVKVPPLADAPAKAAPGLILSMRAGGKLDTRAARLVTLYVPKGEPISPFLPVGPFTATWLGEINSTLRAEYTFAAEIKGVFKLSINGEEILEGAGDTTAQTVNKTVQLKKGGNALVAEFSSDGTSDASIQLKWWAKEFPPEPVPPGVFAHNGNDASLRAGDRVREGRMLFAQLRCAACHDGAGTVPPRGEGMHELAQDAPVFDELGSKYHEAFLAHWINDPHAIRPRSLMPRVFAGEPGKVDPRAADLAAYLVSLGAPDETKPAPENAALGGALFANLGCIACHSAPDADHSKDEHDRVPLGHVRAKWQGTALREFLKNPQKNYQFIRMPHFRLNDEEAERLTAFLLETAKQEFPAPPKGDAAKGAQLLASTGCLNCHAGVPPTTQPKLADTIKAGWDTGCMASDPLKRGNAPDFVLTPPQREALLAFAERGLDSLKQDCAVEFAERQVKNLRCNACHARDAAPSVWSQLEGEMMALTSAAPSTDTPPEGTPAAATTAPPLTWVGEKLQPAWMEQVIAGSTPYKPRPWTTARMPGFVTWAKGLAVGHSFAHGFPLTIERTPTDAAKAKIGEQLIGETGGFNCVQCHGVGERAPTAVFEAPGINFMYSAERLRYDHYLRWVLFPQRVDPDTKMPRFANDEGHTPLTEHLEGKADEQFNAIWHYLHTVAAPQK